MPISLSAAPDDAIRRALLQRPAGYWDFPAANTKEWTHGYHSYPAMMIPQVARHLIQLIRTHQPQIRTLFDPFMGSGTSLVEGILQHLAVTGSDLNPLARLISQAKTTVYDPGWLAQTIPDVLAYAASLSVSEADWPKFAHLTFWFKEPVIAALMRLRRAIDDVVPAGLQPFFWVAFSDTVRWTSNSRNAEFKLYRLDAKRLEAWNPDVFAVFRKVLNRNEIGNRQLASQKPLPPVRLHAANAMNLSAFADASFDLVVTSPPYGDSRTTVAYGQFSRLSLQWLGLDANEERPAPHQLDRSLLGGQPTDALANTLPSPVLQKALGQIAARDPRRAREVLAFYQDLDQALGEIARVLRPGGYQCWVVGNRIVKNVQLLTDHIIIELSERYGLKPIVNVTRSIPLKRMPKENSPTNTAGQKVATMNGEQIFILRKI
ncbi:DNA methyltransferase [Sulfobacillus sp. hq2]|uniref:DNA methyltransferase n=1 Tax=Sulfobacillus TaxID=28033 RepID=UPI000CD3012C|nr:DNA methyltransferase [Sulfobacillus sp. hq2]POB09973.1 DNA methyltransferase [Sulfobacillus sp. hq2]